MKDSDLEWVRNRYQSRIARNGLTHESMNSGGVAKQAIRHAVHAEAIGPDDAVLDFGCGLGEFYQALRARGHRGPYLGIDIVPEYVAFCAGKFPEARFELRNVFQEGLPGGHDVVVASQVFNARYPDSSNIEVLERWLREAWPKARKAVTVDMLTDYVDFTAPDLYYYSPERMLALGKSLTRFVRLRHDYLPFEFCLQLFVGSDRDPGC